MLADGASSRHSPKVFFEGTHRARHPDETWAMIAPRLHTFGITRLADITRLDSIGIPVMMAVRPLAKTLSVSQGKGQTPLLARISAAMECVEVWHAEYACPPAVHCGVPAFALDLPYRVSDLVTEPGGLANDLTPLSWVQANGLVSKQKTVLPTDAVCLSNPVGRSWPPTGIRRSSNGLASGNTHDEAALHALCEVVERDAIARQGGPRDAIDVATIDDHRCGVLIESIAKADVGIEISQVPNRFEVPCFSAYLWSEDFPVICHGSGAHIDPAIAISRAITEAVQTRLTAIAGSRDDLPAIYQQVQRGSSTRPQWARATQSWQEIVATPRPVFYTITGELEWLGDLVARVAGAEPIIADLSTQEAFAVVKVVLPGARLQLERMHRDR